MRKQLWLFFVVIAVVGCATAYTRQGWKGGYTNIKLQDDIYKVSFRGNAYCGEERAENFALLRSSEVALENGYKYFIILDEKAGKQIGVYTSPATATTQGTINTFGNTGSYYGTTTISGGQTYIYNKPLTTNIIKCFKEKPENVLGIVYDAEQIKESIRKQYNLQWISNLRIGDRISGVKRRSCSARFSTR